MTHKNMDERGSVPLTVLSIILVCIIAAIVYMLATGNGKNQSPYRTGRAPRSDEMQLRAATSAVTEFTDGLGTPDVSTQYPLDEFGAGVAAVDVFNVDINSDGRPDRITRTRNENGTAHFYYEYKIELNNGGDFVDITPPDFRTVEGMECALQKIQFVFNPDFRIIKISRPWNESWVTPTLATKTTYTIANNQMMSDSGREMKTICNVADLF